MYFNVMGVCLSLIVFLWVSLSVVLGLFFVLKAKREANPYEQVFLWLISPFTLLAGLVFIGRDRKKHYFERIRSHLFIK
jgi:cell shape-determining protein MreC